MEQKGETLRTKFRLGLITWEEYEPYFEELRNLRCMVVDALRNMRALEGPGYVPTTDEA